MKSYAGRVVVITGAGSGMGRSYALEAARRGAALALNDHDAAALEETVGLLPTGTRVSHRAFDVSDREAMLDFADLVEAELGGADVVLNNAGIEGEVQPVWGTSEDAYRRVMAVNFDGVRHGTRAFLPQVLRSDAGAIVNVSSLFGLVGTPHHSDYCASKFAVRGFTEALAAELVDSGVAVHLVHPGGVATNISRHEASAGFARKYLTTSPDAVAREVLDAVGTRRTRIVLGHRAGSTWLGVRLLPARVMTRLVRRDVGAVLDSSLYPAREHATARRD